MRHASIDPKLFADNRRRLVEILPENSLAVANANDVLPTNADGTLLMHANADLFFLTGVEQEESRLVIAPNAADEKLREVLFIRPSSELLKTWEGYKLSKEDAARVSGVKTVKFLDEFPAVFRRLMCEVEHVYLNTNEHPRAVVEVESRDARFIRATRAAYPLHDYRRLAPLLHRLRVVKTPREIELIKQAVKITADGFRRVLGMVRPGIHEYEVEAELIHEFTRKRARWAYPPIIAGGANSCILHYNQNDQPCRKGDVLLLDVAAAYANYNADLTRTIPVSGKFSRRQKQVYNAVLRVLRKSIAGAVVGKLPKVWLREAQEAMNEELLKLELITERDIQQAPADEPACRKYFMHGLGHPLGLDVHDVGNTNEPIQAGWVLTVEPGLYIPEEGIGIRLENDIVVTADGPVDLMADVPLEADEIEDAMGG
ncbi:MAG: aminopeptidase P N-terminal domain-containing protein [Planctomycetes bacterium]|nr:aminopeptidase P N-terminal domain-containing protein [Planctomycetota bacterium]